MKAGASVLKRRRSLNSAALATAPHPSRPSQVGGSSWCSRRHGWLLWAESGNLMKVDHSASAAAVECLECNVVMSRPQGGQHARLRRSVHTRHERGFCAALQVMITTVATAPLPASHQPHRHSKKHMKTDENCGSSTGASRPRHRGLHRLLRLQAHLLHRRSRSTHRPEQHTRCRARRKARRLRPALPSAHRAHGLQHQGR